MHSVIRRMFPLILALLTVSGCTAPSATEEHTRERDLREYFGFRQIFVDERWVTQHSLAHESRDSTLPMLLRARVDGVHEPENWVLLVASGCSSSDLLQVNRAAFIEGRVHLQVTREIYWQRTTPSTAIWAIVLPMPADNKDHIDVDLEVTVVVHDIECTEPKKLSRHYIKG